MSWNSINIEEELGSGVGGRGGGAGGGGMQTGNLLVIVVPVSGDNQQVVENYIIVNIPPASVAGLKNLQNSSPSPPFASVFALIRLLTRFLTIF